ncbi:uncharacterized protein LOC143282562 [Babylonia areolata]|uniref:uncharacterized protein LOC143282562 n=1 Tax=Babylonia areolata TaxID=304850 RepID=UPI003FD19DFF
MRKESSVHVPPTVHYVWCQSNKEFRFQHYLGLLSVLRLLQPLKIVFHYLELPAIDRLWYHVWFWELKQSFASLELRRLEKNQRNCDAKNLLDTAFGVLASRGGFYIGPNVVLTRFPKDIVSKPFWVGMTGATPGVLFVRDSFNNDKKLEFIKRAVSEAKTCGDVDAYNQAGALSGPPCVLLTNEIRPKDIVTAVTPFAEMARWLYYGKRKSNTSSIPRIAHMTWLDPSGGGQKKRPFHFFHFLSVLSALHVAGLRHVYVHGDVSPDGEWWERLRGENITFVPVEAISQVYQQFVRLAAHRSDIVRSHVLRMYGGVYMDVDVMWVNRIPDDLLRYPTVACPDWPSRDQWPEAFNIGVLMSQSDSPWLRHFLSSLRRYLDNIWYFNAIMMPYHVYERHPESLYIDRYLQVICFQGNCHPAWHDDYIRDINDPRPPRDFHWREGRSYHFTVPKPPQSLTSPAEIRKKKDMYAKIGHLILTKSGRGALIGEA